MVELKYDTMVKKISQSITWTRTTLTRICSFSSVYDINFTRRFIQDSYSSPKPFARKKSAEHAYQRRCKRIKLVQHHTRFLFFWNGHHVDLTQSSACTLSTCYRTELSKVECSDKAYRVRAGAICGDLHMRPEFGGSLDENWA